MIIKGINIKFYVPPFEECKKFSKNEFRDSVKVWYEYDHTIYRGCEAIGCKRSVGFTDRVANPEWSFPAPNPVEIIDTIKKLKNFNGEVKIKFDGYMWFAVYTCGPNKIVIEDINPVIAVLKLYRMIKSMRSKQSCMMIKP